MQQLLLHIRVKIDIELDSGVSWRPCFNSVDYERVLADIYNILHIAYV